MLERNERVHVQIILLASSLTVQLRGGARGSAWVEVEGCEGKYALPIVPSAFFACHHFPCLSTISSISPFVNEISFGSSGDAVSADDKSVPSHEAKDVKVRTCVKGLGLV